MDRVFKVGEGMGGPAQPGEGCKLPPAGFRADRAHARRQLHHALNATQNCVCIYVLILRRRNVPHLHDIGNVQPTTSSRWMFGKESLSRAPKVSRRVLGISLFLTNSHLPLCSSIVTSIFLLHLHGI